MRRSISVICLALLTVSIGCIGRESTTSDAGPPDSSTDVVASSSSSSDDQLLARLDSTLDMVLTHRDLNLRDHAAWQIIHGALAFQRAFPVLDGEKRVSAIDYVLQGGAMKGWEFEPGDLLDPSTGRRGLRAIQAPGSKSGQGHADQWLGYLAECGLKSDQTIRVGSTTFTIADLVAQIELDVPRNVELEYSWTLMGLTSYRPTDYQWTASDGQSWSIERLVQVEAEHDLAASPCGGAHRLYGLTMAVNRHFAQGGKAEGAWQLANERILDSVRRAKEYQNPDGSFSSNYFQRPGTSADITQSLGSSGHVFEFLTLAMADEQIREPWMKKGALRMCEILEVTKDIPLECGALYHAAHGLVLYRDRLFGSREYALPSSPSTTLSQRNTSTGK